MKEWKIFNTKENLSRETLERTLNDIEECGWSVQCITNEETVKSVYYIYAWKKKRIDIEEPINMKHIEGLAIKEY